MREGKTTTLPEKYRAGFLKDLDGRFELAKLLRHSYREIANDLGGEESLSTIQKSLIERFCFLSAVLRGIELQMGKLATDGTDITDAMQDLLRRHIFCLNSFTGLAKSLGLKRERRKLESLDEYKRKFDKSRGRGR